ncbi:hypothetical protein FRC08_001634 [Ceratobasidium sp. 394]|nr:hypothetical protein FRC08_001634 [Ceratobasidium sp. 394]
MPTSTLASVYILPAIAVSSMNGLINHIKDPVRFKVENLLRNPYDMDISASDALRSLLFTHIQRFDLYFFSQYGNTGLLLGGQRWGARLAGDDERFFDLFCMDYKSEEFPMGSRTGVWSLPPTVPTISPPPPSSSLFTFSTAFNPALGINRKLPKAMGENNAAWTKAQRAAALQALRPTSLEHFQQLMTNQLRRGWKLPNQYVYLPSSLVNTTDVLVRGVTESAHDIIFCRLSNDTIPQEVKQDLLARMKDVLGIGDEQVDSAKFPDDHEYLAYHFGWWNRYTLSGSNHPSDVCARARAVQVTQSLPYLDRSSLKLAGTFTLEHAGNSPMAEFHQIVAGCIEPAVEKLTRLLAPLMQEHEVLQASIGARYDLGCAPFCMTVVNIMPATKCHRDSSDMVDSICLIMALGSFTGGELGLMEPGGVIELCHGEMVAIRSRRDVHFNLDFKGQRLSLVFTSDKTIRRWSKERNRWELLDPAEPGGAEASEDEVSESGEESQYSEGDFPADDY